MHNKIRTCRQLLEEYQADNSSNNSSVKLNFLLGDREGKDVYNITAPFEWEGKTLLAGRVEDRDSEHSEVIFFEQKGESWVPVEEAPVLQLQDPFVTKVDDLLVVGGVEIFPDEENPGALCWRTIFYRGASIKELKRFAKGPDKMKDIRLLQLADKRILAAVRPQGAVGGRGKIGFTIINTLEELTEETINKADILKGQFIDEEWGGCNEMHLLENGKVGILSHIACFDEKGGRHYYSTCFVYDVETKDYTPMKMISARKDFAPGASKRPDLEDVIFSGGLIRTHDGKAQLFCGVGDAEAHMRVIEDPFGDEK